LGSGNYVVKLSQNAAVHSNAISVRN
jgi:hypothetical protein